MTNKSYTIKLFAITTTIGFIAVIAFSGWQEIYKKYLERTPPTVEFSEGQPRGIGISPVSIGLRLKDEGAGLDEVVVRIRQRGHSKEVYRKTLAGTKQAEVSVEFAGEKSGLEEGAMSLEVRAFDRSIWSNSKTETIDLRVDYRKPRVEVLSAMHNTRRGGSQLLFYKASDDSLAVSGVKVDNQTFLGFPARVIDKDFEDPSIYVVLYAIGLEQRGDDFPIRVFAQDMVGNGNSTSFNYKILGRPDRTQNINLTEDFLRGPITELADTNFNKLAEHAQITGGKLKRESSPGSNERLIENFKIVSERLRSLNEEEIVGILRKSGHFDKYFNDAFEQQPGPVNIGFGDKLNFKYGSNIIESYLSNGFEFTLNKDGVALAAQDGVVIFSQNIGVYGRVVAIDHGLGLVSIYGKLQSVSVAPGETVSTGQEIGVAGKSGLGRNNQIYFEMRLQGVPIDPREWWDRSWYYDHILEQINSVKRILGMAVTRSVQDKF